MGWFKRGHQESSAEVSVDEQVEVVRAVLEHYPAGARLHFGAPTRCPDCGDYGMVLHTAHDRGICANECFSCRTEWTITLTALREHRRRSRPTPVVSKPKPLWPATAEEPAAPVEREEPRPVFEIPPVAAPKALGSTLYVDLG